MTDSAGDSDGVPWRRTTRWRPSQPHSQSGGVPVEHPMTGDVGYCKTAAGRASSPAREWIASALAREVGVAVPECRIGRLEGHDGLVSVSLAWGAESVDLHGLRAQGRVDTPAVQAALRAASGLLAFQVWLLPHIGEHRHLMVAEARDGTLQIAAIDYSRSLDGSSHRLPAELPHFPPALRRAPDPAQVAGTVARIEACTQDRIAALVHALPLAVMSGGPPDHAPEQEAMWRGSYIRGLQWRRDLVRGAMERAGWWPRSPQAAAAG